jgi:hypothetical protein
VLCHRGEPSRLNNTSSFDNTVQGNTTVLIDLMQSEQETKLKPVRWHSLGHPPRIQEFGRPASAVHGPINVQSISRQNSAAQLYGGRETPATASDLDLGRPSYGTRSNDVSRLSSRMSGSTISDSYEHARIRSHGSGSSVSSSESSDVSTNSELLSSSFGGSDTSGDDGTSYIGAPKDSQGQSLFLKLKQTVSTAAFSHATTHGQSGSASSHNQKLPYVTKLSATRTTSGRPPTAPAASTFSDGVASIFGYQTSPVHHR